MDKLPRQFLNARSIVGHLRRCTRATFHTSGCTRKDEKDGDNNDCKGEVPPEKTPDQSEPFSRKDKRPKLSPEGRLQELLSEYKMPQEYVHVMDEIFSSPQGVLTSPPKERSEGSVNETVQANPPLKEGHPQSETKMTPETSDHDDDGWGLGLENVKFPEDGKLFVSPFHKTGDSNGGEGKVPSEKKWHPRRKMSPLQRVHELIPREYWTKIEDKNMENIVVEMKKLDPKLPDDKD